MAFAHSEKSKTITLLVQQYYLKGLRNTVETYIANCQKCRCSIVSQNKTPGYLHSLPVLQRLWQYFTIDFKLFSVDEKGYNAILVVIDWLNKQFITVPYYKTIDFWQLAELFLQYIWCRDGFSDFIVSDRGPQFVSLFWAEVYRILGIQVKFSTVFHL